MLAVDADLHAGARLHAEGLQNRIARLTEHLNPQRRLERLGVRLLCALPDDPYMRLHRRGVGVDLDDRHFVAILIHVLVERDQPWLLGPNELDEARHTLSLAIELPWLEPVGGDKDERRRHGGSSCVSSTRGLVLRASGPPSRQAAS